MGEPRDENRLSAGERRELRRINHSMGTVAAYLGKESERTAESICQELRQIGTIEKFWHIPSQSTLDKQGIDFICQTPRGYFLINVKKSAFGVMSFDREGERRRESNKQSLLIYSWRVTLEGIVKSQEAKKELETVLSKDPSFASGGLPDYIKQELASPTYPSRTLRKETSLKDQVEEGVNLTVLDQLGLMKKRGLLTAVCLEQKRVWQVRITAVVQGSLVEVVKHGGHDQTEKEALEELLNEVKRRVA